MSSATKNWTFDSDQESWTNNVSSGSATFFVSTGDPSSGTLQVAVADSGVGGSVYWQYKGSYAAIFGVSTAVTINSIGGGAGDDFHWKHASPYGASGCNLGPFTLRTTQGTTILGTFSPVTTIATVVSAWTTRALGSINVAGLSHTGQTSIILRIAYSASMGKTAGSKSEVYLDSFTFTIDYTSPGYSLTAYPLTQSQTLGAAAMWQLHQLYW